jgi:hypothetical protein
MTETRAKELTLIMWNRIKELYNNKEYEEDIAVSKIKVLTDMLTDKIINQIEINHMLWNCFLCTYFNNNGHLDCEKCPLKSCISDDSIYESIILSTREEIIKKIDTLISTVSDWTPID